MFDPCLSSVAGLRRATQRFLSSRGSDVRRPEPKIDDVVTPRALIVNFVYKQANYGANYGFNYGANYGMVLTMVLGMVHYGVYNDLQLDIRRYIDRSIKKLITEGPALAGCLHINIYGIITLYHVQFFQPCPCILQWPTLEPCPQQSILQCCSQILCSASMYLTLLYLYVCVSNCMHVIYIYTHKETISMRTEHQDPSN